MPVKGPGSRSGGFFGLDPARDENTCRKNYTPEEAVHLCERIEKLEKPKVVKRNIEGKKRGGRISTKRQDSTGKTLPSVIRDESARLTSRAAKVVGMSRPS